MKTLTLCSLVAVVLTCCGVATATSSPGGELLDDEGRELVRSGEPSAGADGGSEPSASDGGCIERREWRRIDGESCNCTMLICPSERRETRGNCTETKTDTSSTYVCRTAATGKTVLSVTTTTSLLACSSGCSKPYKDSRLPSGANAEIDSVSTLSVSVNGGPATTTTGVTASWYSATGSWRGAAFTPPAPGNDLSTCF